MGYRRLVSSRSRTNLADWYIMRQLLVLSTVASHAIFVASHENSVLAPGLATAVPPIAEPPNVYSWLGMKAAIAESAGALMITLPGASFDSDYDSEIRILTNITIFGNDAVLDAQRQGRFFAVNSGASLSVDSLTFQRGLCDFGDFAGGAIFSNGTLSVGNSVFASNEASTTEGNGGAIFSTGHALQISSSIFTGNKARNGGAVSALRWMGILNINGTAFNNNSASSGGGAVFLFNGVQASITKSTFNSNVGHKAGAVYLEKDAHADISGTFFVSNHANERGGAVYSDRVIGAPNMQLDGAAAFIGNSCSGYEPGPCGSDIFVNGDSVIFAHCSNVTMDGCCTLPQLPITCFSCKSTTGQCVADPKGSKTADGCIATCRCVTPHNCGQLNSTAACGAVITGCNVCDMCCKPWLTVQASCDGCFATPAPNGCGGGGVKD